MKVHVVSWPWFGLGGSFILVLFLKKKNCFVPVFSIAENCKTLMCVLMFWPNMHNDVESYACTYLTCQQDKAVNQLPGGLLQQLPIPVWPWASVSMDFITQLLLVNDLPNIMVVSRQVFKICNFRGVPSAMSSWRCCRILLLNCGEYWSIPLNIISDRDPMLTSIFWSKLFKLMGTKILMSTTYHLQMDGLTEWINGILEDYVRHFVCG